MANQISTVVFHVKVDVVHPKDASEGQIIEAAINQFDEYGSEINVSAVYLKDETTNKEVRYPEIFNDDN